MKKLLSALTISFLFISCAAQYQIADRITKTSVVIYNNTNNELNILLGSKTKLDTFKLEKNDVWLSQPYNFNPIFKIQTQNHIVTYQLRLGKYYMIFWNVKKKYWDLKKTKKRQQ